MDTRNGIEALQQKNNLFIFAKHQKVCELTDCRINFVCSPLNFIAA